MTSFFKKLWAFLFGSKKFVPYCKQDMLSRSGRFYVRFIFTDYRRWAGLFDWGYRYRRGVLNLSLYFNPVLPPELFKALLMLGGDDGEMETQFIPMTGLDPDDPDSFEETIERAIEGVDDNPWSYNTVIRDSGDLKGVHDWIDKVRECIEEHTDRLGGDIQPGEKKMITHLLGMLTERTATCNLNS